MAETNEQGSQPAVRPIDKIREDFRSVYANSVRYHVSAWDLKMIFGELDQTPGADHPVENHTAVTVSWPTVIIMAYFLSANMVLHETINGPINMAGSAFPPRPDPSSDTWKNTDKQVVLYLGWIWDQFFSGTPYVPPEVEAATAPQSKE